MKKLIRKIIIWATADENPETIKVNNIGYNSVKTGNTSNLLLENVRSINLNVFTADGGYVVLCNGRQRLHDEIGRNSTLYVITKNDNLGEELAQIITRTSLSS